MKAIFLTLTAACCCGFSHARADEQARNVAGNIAASIEDAGVALTISAKPPPEVRSLLQENVLAQDERFTTVSASPDYLDLLRKARTLLGRRLDVRSSGSQGLAAVMQRTNNLTAINAEPLGTLPDSGRRESVLFKLANEKLGMLTVWDYAADGGKIVLSADFARQRVGESAATLALVKRPGGDDRRMWKLTWTTAAENYELYLEDAKMSDRDTYWQPETIMKLAEGLMK